MGLFSFKTRAPKKFEYRPLYFDPDKEAFQSRMDKIKKELEEDNNGHTVRAKISIRDAYEKKHGRGKLENKGKSSKIRLLIIVLSIIFLLIFFYLMGLLSLYLVNNG